MRVHEELARGETFMFVPVKHFNLAWIINCGGVHQHSDTMDNPSCQGCYMCSRMVFVQNRTTIEQVLQYIVSMEVKLPGSF